MSENGNGKGDTPRPFSVDQETFANNWERIFGKKTNQHKEQENGSHDASERNQDH